ncbi:hypothetical protein PSPO01_09469 [Paraphaeosphaeria sporulosa]
MACRVDADAAAAPSASRAVTSRAASSSQSASPHCIVVERAVHARSLRPVGASRFAAAEPTPDDRRARIVAALGSGGGCAACRALGTRGRHGEEGKEVRLLANVPMGTALLAGVLACSSARACAG